MSILDSISKRRSFYNINKEYPEGVNDDTVVETVKRAARFSPEAFGVMAGRIVIAQGRRHDELWDAIDDAFEGKVAREKIDTFKAGLGTILYFYDEDTVRMMQEKHELYKDNFPLWVHQGSGMLQLSIWTALRELNLGASLQHYNPVIDERVHEMFDVPQNYTLVAQMPYGGIAAPPDPKDKPDPSDRIKLAR